MDSIIEKILEDIIEVVMYRRVSTTKQVEEGEGLNIQKERIEKFCKKNNYKVVKDFVDDESGAKDASDRPKVIEMINYCKNPPIKYVIIDKPDRLSRDYYQMLYIEKELLVNNVKVLFAEQENLNVDNNDNPMDKALKEAMRQMMGVFAELDRKMINKRLTDGLRKKAENGNKPAGRQPFGYEYSRDKKTTIVNRYQAQIVRDAFEMRAEGKSYVIIADTLKKRKAAGVDKYAYVGRNKNRKWAWQTVSDMLCNDYYIGKVTHAGEKIAGNHQPIIDIDLWNRVNKKV